MLVLDSGGAERYRLEGYVPRDEFAAQARLGLARVSFMAKRWEEAERVYDEIVRELGNTRSAAEAVYWRGVCRYKRTSDHAALAAIKDDFARTGHADSLWALKASVW